MTKYTVRRRVDAQIFYETTVVASDAIEASKIAAYNDSNFTWEETGQATYDNRTFETITDSGEVIEGTEIN